MSTVQHYPNAPIVEAVIDLRVEPRPDLKVKDLTFNYLSDHAGSLGKRWRLQSPFLEHFSQAFARFFMRVGLPSKIPPFK